MSAPHGRLIVLAAAAWSLLLPGESARAQMPTDGKGLYEIGCARCHGPDGAGADMSQLGVAAQPADFSDCRFAQREPDADWMAVSHQGGPARAFSQSMPAFGEAFTEAQLQLILDYVRGFCDDKRWPRGELNLPRPLVTEKAFPEDEAVWLVDARTEGDGAILNRLYYEKRFGPRFMAEVILPFESREAPRPDGGWSTGLGDVVVAGKYALLHDLDAGSIVSIAAEVKLPTGSADKGRGSGTTVFEPYVAWGQMLSDSAFLHFQGGAEISTDTDKAGNEAFWRAAVGNTWSQNKWGRSWTPMVEVLGALPLESGGTVGWDVVPQVQVSLSRRQHVLANLGVRLPLSEADERPVRLLFYVLWDWFDGGLFQGW